MKKEIKDWEAFLTCKWIYKIYYWLIRKKISEEKCAKDMNRECTEKEIWMVNVKMLNLSNHVHKWK